MIRLLFLAYFFPPLGGGGTQRSVGFARHLPTFGYEPVVITGPTTHAQRWAPADTTLMARLPRDLEIHCVPGPPPDDDASHRRLRRWLDVPTPFARWWTAGAVATGVQAAAGGINAIYATMSPFETGAAAAALSRRLGLPWVADLRDPWALDEMQGYATALHRLREESRMRAVLASAAAIVMNTREAAIALRKRFPELAAKRVKVIPNGYDAEDFAGWPASGDPERFRIVHTGTLHTRLGRRTRQTGPLRRALGGEVDVDVLTRSPVFLLEALARLRAHDPSLGERLELHLAGQLDNEDRRVAQAPGVHVHGYVSHAQSAELVRSADLLFLPMHELPPGRRARIVPGKTYEYVGSGRPILAAVPDGDARDLLHALPQAWVCGPSDVTAMAETIARLAAKKDVAGREPDQMNATTAIYERRQLALQLAVALDEVLGRTPAQVRMAPPRLRLVS